MSVQTTIHFVIIVSYHKSWMIHRNIGSSDRDHRIIRSSDRIHQIIGSDSSHRIHQIIGSDSSDRIHRIVGSHNPHEGSGECFNRVSCIVVPIRASFAIQASIITVRTKPPTPSPFTPAFIWVTHVYCVKILSVKRKSDKWIPVSHVLLCGSASDG